MKKPTSWDLYFQKQLGDPEMRGLIDEEVESFRVGIQIARWRQKKRLSQAQLAARTGMSAPDISRLERPSQDERSEHFTHREQPGSEHDAGDAGEDRAIGGFWAWSIHHPSKTAGKCELTVAPPQNSTNSLTTSLSRRYCACVVGAGRSRSILLLSSSGISASY